MAELSDIYNTRILELAAAIPRTKRLEQPEATATAHSKLCGSTVVVDIVMDGDTFADYGQTVKACLLGQSSASVVGREIVGTTRTEFAEVAEAMRRMLRDGGPGPEGRWCDLRVLEPVKDYRARHASTLLVFEAVERALSAYDTRHALAAAGA
ncbi:MAG: iron-sulfur cluster assembly scaffold protein [Hyphomicrobiaceae bacterium]